MNLFFIYTICFLLGAAGAWFIARYGFGLGIVDYPTQRSSHQKPVPKGGGIGIALSFVLLCLYVRLPFLFWFPALLISALGFLTDKRDISPGLRLFLQLALTSVILLNILTFKGPFNYILGLFFLIYIVGTANFYNFMDGINGIASLTGIAAFLLMFFYIGFYSPDNMVLGVICIGMALSCIGFLPFNIGKARVFLGDGASLLLGLVYAGLTVYISRTVVDLICLSSFLFTFYADEFLSMVPRVLRKESLARPHRGHFYQILANEGNMAHWKISFVYVLFQLIIGGSILALRQSGLPVIILTLSGYFLVFAVLNFFARRRFLRRP